MTSVHTIDQESVIDQESLATAIIELNSMSRKEGVIMTQEGVIQTGNSNDEDFLCMLIPAAILARQLCADGLSSYTGKELSQWANDYDCTAVLEIIQQAQN